MPNQSIQPSFAAGEISSALYARVDVNAYWIALRQAINVIIMPQGGAVSRPGSQYAGPCKDHTFAPRLLRWRHSSGNTYFLEFGNLNMRVNLNGAHVTDTSSVISGITQAAQAVFTTTAAHGLSAGDEVFIEGVVGMTEMNNRRFLVDTATGTTTFSIDYQNPAVGTSVDSSGYGAWSAAGTVKRIMTVTTPWDNDEVQEFGYQASPGVFSITHPDFDVREIESTGTATWTVSTFTAGETTDHPIDGVVTANATAAVSYDYQVTLIDLETGEESLPGLENTDVVFASVSKANPAVVTDVGHPFITGDQIEINGEGAMTELNGRRFYLTKVDADNYSLDGEDSSAYGATGTGGTSNLCWTQITNGHATPNNTVTWALPTTFPARYEHWIYRRDTDSGVFGWIGASTGNSLSFTDINIDPDFSVSPPQYRNPFLGAGNYPAAVGFYQQRRIFGGADDWPATSEFSKIGNYENFSQASPSAADDAFSMTLPSLEAGRIRWYVQQPALITLTENSEWTVKAFTGSTEGFSGDSVTTQPETDKGVGDIPPILAGKKILIAQTLGKRIYDISYSLAQDGYDALDLTMLATHLFENYGLVGWDYAQKPHSLIVGARSDGVGLCLTFKPEQKVTAWTRWTTQGYFQTFACGEEAALGEDAIYTVAKRSINGVDHYFTERFASRFIDSDVQDYVGVDASLSLDNPITITGATAANPVVITATAHGLSNGDEIDIDDIIWTPNVDSDFNETQPAQLNKLGPFKVANKAANTFELTDTSDVNINGTGYTSYVSGGAARLRVSSVGGLWHLEGVTDAAVLYNGAVAINQTITNGTWTVPNSGKASRIHVGLRYNCDMETLNIETKSSGATVQGRQKHMPFLWTRLTDTAGVLVGPDTSHLNKLIQAGDTLADNTETTLHSGDVKSILEQSWNTNGRIFYRQPYPLPMAILAVIPAVSLGGS